MKTSRATYDALRGVTRKGLGIDGNGASNGENHGGLHVVEATRNFRVSRRYWSEVVEKNLSNGQKFKGCQENGDAQGID